MAFLGRILGLKKPDAGVEDKKAKVAHLGSNNTLFYDEKLKRWVDPSAPKDVADDKPPPPPMTATAFQHTPAFSKKDIRSRYVNTFNTQPKSETPAPPTGLFPQPQLVPAPPAQAVGQPSFPQSLSEVSELEKRCNENIWTQQQEEWVTNYQLVPPVLQKTECGEKQHKPGKLRTQEPWHGLSNAEESVAEWVKHAAGELHHTSGESLPCADGTAESGAAPTGPGPLANVLDQERANSGPASAEISSGYSGNFVSLADVFKGNQAPPLNGFFVPQAPYEDAPNWSSVYSNQAKDSTAKRAVVDAVQTPSPVEVQSLAGSDSPQAAFYNHDHVPGHSVTDPAPFVDPEETAGPSISPVDPLSAAEDVAVSGPVTHFGLDPPGSNHFSPFHSHGIPAAAGQEAAHAADFFETYTPGYAQPQARLAATHAADNSYPTYAQGFALAPEVQETPHATNGLHASYIAANAQQKQGKEVTHASNGSCSPNSATDMHHNAAQEALVDANGFHSSYSLGDAQPQAFQEAYASKIVQSPANTHSQGGQETDHPADDFFSTFPPFDALQQQSHYGAPAYDFFAADNANETQPQSDPADGALTSCSPGLAQHEAEAHAQAVQHIPTVVETTNSSQQVAVPQHDEMLWTAGQLWNELEILRSQYNFPIPDYTFTSLYNMRVYGSPYGPQGPYSATAAAVQAEYPEKANVGGAAGDLRVDALQPAAVAAADSAPQTPPGAEQNAVPKAASAEPSSTLFYSAGDRRVDEEDSGDALTADAEDIGLRMPSVSLLAAFEQYQRGDDADKVKMDTKDSSPISAVLAQQENGSKVGLDTEDSAPITTVVAQQGQSVEAAFGCTVGVADLGADFFNRANTPVPVTEPQADLVVEQLKVVQGLVAAAEQPPAKPELAVVDAATTTADLELLGLGSVPISKDTSCDDIEPMATKEYISECMSSISESEASQLLVTMLAYLINKAKMSFPEIFAIMFASGNALEVSSSN